MTKIAQQGNSVSHRHRCRGEVAIETWWTNKKKIGSDRSQETWDWIESVVGWACSSTARTNTCLLLRKLTCIRRAIRYAWRALLVHFDCLHSIFSHVWRTFSNLRFVFWLLFSVCYFELFLCWCGVFWFHSFLAGLKACTGICTPPNQIPTAYFEKCAIFTHSTKLPATMSEALLHCRFSPITISLLLTFQ